MLRPVSATTESADIIHESLVGLARNIAASRQAPIDREGSKTIVGYALARLNSHEIALLLSGHHKAINRTAEEIASLFAEADAYGEAFDRKLLLGEPLDLAEVISEAIESLSMRRSSKRPAKFFAMFEIERLSRKPAKDQSCGHYMQTGAGGETTAVHYKGTRVHREPLEGPAISVMRPGGQVVRAMYFRDGILHRPSAEGPAAIEHDEEGRVIYEGYFEEGKFHRDPLVGPALHVIGPEFERIEYLKNGKLHRDPGIGPALRILLTEEGRERFEYFVEGAPHRAEFDGPAWIETDCNTGVIVDEQYFQNGELHRLGGPAVTSRGSEGAVLFEAWHRNGKLDRDPAEGPAVVFRNDDGSYAVAEFWREGALLELATDAEAQP